MKKLMPVLIFAIISSAHAETIHCPTPDNYLVDGKQWKLELGRTRASGDSTGDMLFLTHSFYDYNPTTKKVADGGEVKSINFDVTAKKPIQRDTEITLQCTGTYSSSEETPGIIWNSYDNYKDTIKAELLFNISDYKTCVLGADNRSFDCSK